MFNTSRRPDVCSQYDEQTCWYKPTFHTQDTVDTARLDADAWERLIPMLNYNKKGYITNMPDWETIKGLAKNA
ncbi:MAG: hypothetical protein AAF125_08325 [Chloroflexota bacterium]